MSALYRHYRPQIFAEISGQDHITATLQQAILQDRIVHAYLFQGPRGTGKTTTARVLAKRLNCLKPKKAEPCGSCRLCLATAENKNIDIIEIDAASNRGIDDIRALRDTISLSPSMSKYKVYIIDEVHMLTNEAFAALLKTLEEPVKHAVFILATTELHKVPPTIASRCQVFRFRRATDEEMRTRLLHILKAEKRTVEDEVIQFITQRSDGCYRDAESLLGQMLTASQDKKVSLTLVTQLLGFPPPARMTDFLTALVESNAVQALELIDQAYQQGFDPEQFTQETIRMARDGAVAFLKDPSTAPAFAKVPGASQCLPNIIRALLQAIQDIAYVPQPMIALQLAILSVCQASGAGKAPTVHLRSVQRDDPPLHPRSVKKDDLLQSTPLLDGTPRPGGVATHNPSTSLPAGQTGSGQALEPISRSPSAVSIQKITEGWPSVIEAIKGKNPVGATFLRATEPVACEGKVITLQVQFPLHKNFFDKPQNRILVEEALKSVFQIDLSIRCQLDENAPNPQQRQQQREQQDTELLKNVQEVFGVNQEVKV